MMKKLITSFEGIVLRVLMIILGLFIIGFGTYLYIDAASEQGLGVGIIIALIEQTGKLLD